MTISHVDQRVRGYGSEEWRESRHDRMRIRALVERDDEIIARARRFGEAGPEIVLIAPAAEVERECRGVVGQVERQLRRVVVAIGRYPGATA
jgi:hypothetical protein